MSDNKHDSNTRKLTAGVKAGGCAAKISASELAEILSGIQTIKCEALITSTENFEDAAVYKLTEDLAIIQTVDFFPPLVDDPYLYGQIAATNAISDIYAMGGTPILALNVLCFPTCDYPLDVVREILRGGAQQAEKAGVIIAGGHSIQSHEPLYGLAVTGTVEPSRVLTNCGAQLGNSLVLCKPVGTGVGLLGMKAGLLSDQALRALTGSMTTLSKTALECALKYTITAATDITGFGLLGHLHEMAKGSKLAIQLKADAVPLLPEVLELAASGFVPGGAYANRKSFEQFTTYINDVDLALCDLLYDPQTSGGMLFALKESEVSDALSDLKNSGVEAACIGCFIDGRSGAIEVVCDEKNS